MEVLKIIVLRQRSKTKESTCVCGLRKIQTHLRSQKADQWLPGGMGGGGRAKGMQGWGIFGGGGCVQCPDCGNDFTGAYSHWSLSHRTLSICDVHVCNFQLLRAISERSRWLWLGGWIPGSGCSGKKRIAFSSKRVIPSFPYVLPGLRAQMIRVTCDDVFFSPAGHFSKIL